MEGATRLRTDTHLIVLSSHAKHPPDAPAPWITSHPYIPGTLH